MSMQPTNRHTNRHIGLRARRRQSPRSIVVATACCLWLAFSCSGELRSAEPIEKTALRPTSGVSATFSIVAVDPQSGVCGAAVASKYPAVGRVVPYVRAGVGAFCTQHWHEPKWGTPALDALAAGKSPQQVLADLLKDDPRRDQRQLAIVDMQGRTAQHNPTAADGASLYWGAMSGRFYACQGNTLAGRDVIVGMGRAYDETKGSLADRLIAALLAADAAGGDHRGRLAAGIRVAKNGIAKNGVEGDWLYLGVDESDDAVTELAKKYIALDHEAKGKWPDGKPPFTMPEAAAGDKAPDGKPDPAK